MRVSHRSYSVYVKCHVFYAFPCLLVRIFVGKNRVRLQRGLYLPLENPLEIEAH